jgi:hypothetical protein
MGPGFRLTPMRLSLAVLSVLLVLLFFFSAPSAPSQTKDLKGQLSLYLAGHDRPVAEGAAGLRYIPSFSLKQEIGRGLALDAEVQANIFAAVQGPAFSGARTSGDVKPYRLWVRLSTDRFEARLGLQKINFGSAMLLRPLMWFDRLDPNDPLQLTDGVKGLLLKYTFRTNAGLWLWGLAGNDDLKGWETAPTRRPAPEFGGRLQIPALAGELALTFHHRRMDTRRSLVPLPPSEGESVPEDRLGFDGKWDVGAGLWIEAVLSRQGYASYPLKFQKTVNIGLDYTFVLGNGLHFLAEHLFVDASARLWSGGKSRSLTALTLDYPLGLLDRVRGMVFRDWSSGNWYRLVTWQRTYDNWSLIAIGFWNPDRYEIYTGRSGAALFAGRGFQVMVVFNH